MIVGECKWVLSLGEGGSIIEYHTWGFCNLTVISGCALGLLEASVLGGKIRSAMCSRYTGGVWHASRHCAQASYYLLPVHKSPAYHGII